jgi:outer membrane protein W
VGSAKQLPPTVNVQYYFLGSDSKFRPYAGVGVNYTFFWDEEVTDEFEANPLFEVRGIAAEADSSASMRVDKATKYRSMMAWIEYNTLTN